MPLKKSKPLRVDEFLKKDIWGANRGKSGMYDFFSQFGYAESKNGGYQK